MPSVNSKICGCQHREEKIILSVILVHTQKAKKVLGYQVAKHFLRFFCVSRQNTESGISGPRKFLATFKSVSPKYAFRFYVQ